MRLRILVATLLAASMCAAPARAAGPREFARLERVDVEPWFEGLARVRAWLTLIQLDGRPIEGVRSDDLQLVIGNARKTDVPWISTWEATEDELHVVVLVEVGSPYAGAMEVLATVGPEFLKKLPKHAKVAVMGYGAKVTKGAKLGDIKAAQRAWKKLRAEDEQDDLDLKLSKGVEAAVKLLANAELERPVNTVRRVIVLISDGVEGKEEVYSEIVTESGVALDPLQQEPRAEMRKRLKKAIKQANEAGVTIHAVGFSPYDVRYAMRNLGQLALKTDGTFRLAKDVEMIQGQLGNLVDEIKRQRVLTFFVPAESVAAGGANASIWCKSAQCGAELPLKSNAKKLPPARCGGAECAAGQACIAAACKALEPPGSGWLFWVLGIVGALGLVGGGLVLAKRRREQQIVGLGVGVGAGVGVAPPPAGPATGMRAAVGAPAPHVAPHPAPRPQAAPSRQMPTPHAAAAPPIGWLLIMSGPRQGQNVPVRHGFTIGKAPGNDLVIDDGFTSGRHAQIVVDGAGPLINDVGSTNGTFVNGVHTMSSRLAHGTSVRIGQTELRFLKG